jgi:hypothetical protein
VELERHRGGDGACAPQALSGHWILNTFRKRGADPKRWLEGCRRVHRVVLAHGGTAVARDLQLELHWTNLQCKVAFLTSGLRHHCLDTSTQFYFIMRVVPEQVY